jgi:hypothetical protein
MTQNPAWGFSRTDAGGPWAWGLLGGDVLTNVFDRLKNFETMTWAEIEGDRSHLIEVDGIEREAQQRLQAIGQADVPALFSFNIAGKPRVWGIRPPGDRVLYLLWWDPKHEVCRSLKKHT